MDEKNLPLIKTFLWKCFFIGLLLTVIFALVYLFASEPISNVANNMLGMEMEEYKELWFEFMTYAKIIILYFFLVPALAVSCMCCKKCCCKKDEE